MNIESHEASGGRWFSRLIIFMIFMVGEFGFFPTEKIFSAQNGKEDKAGRLLQKDAITAFICRDKEKNAINLTMLIANNKSLTSKIQKMVGRNVLPLIFSVSTVPGQTYYFNPTFLQFEQQGKSWQPDSSALDSLIIILEKNGKFGGIVEGGQTHQAVLLLPGWFNIDEPIYVRYIEKEQMQFQMTQANKMP